MPKTPPLADPRRIAPLRALGGAVLVLIAAATPIANAAPAPPGTTDCDQYARDAIAAAIQARLGQCGFTGSRWSEDFHFHRDWCRDRAAPRQPNEEAGARAAELARCLPAATTPAPQATPPQPIDKADYCRIYADEAVQAAARNTAAGCRLQGPRWSPDHAFHFTWCRDRATPAQVVAEQQARAQEIDACDGGDPLLVPGLTMALWHGWCPGEFGSHGEDTPATYGDVGGTSNTTAGRESWYQMLNRPRRAHASRLEPRCGGDLGAPEAVGFNWMTLEDGDTAIDPSRLPPGIPLALYHTVNQSGPHAARAFGEVPYNTADDDVPAPIPGLRVRVAADTLEQPGYLGGSHKLPDPKVGYIWFETAGDPRTADWSLADRLPRFTVIGLTHSGAQRDKRFYWLGPSGAFEQYDATCWACPVPPGYVRIHGGDMGAIRGVGFYWFMKVVGPSLAADR